MSSVPLLDTRLDLPLVRRGKVRDVYDAGAGHLLIVATDRISAFDYVLGSGIPDKGRILTQMSAFWFGLLADVTPNHLISMEPADFPAEVRPDADLLRGRAMLVRRTDPLPVECVARGYLSGSGWKDYLRTGAVCGHALPSGLRESARLPGAIFTPATKAQSGHDENITEAEAAAIVGEETAARLREITLALYARGAAHAEHAGIIVADTKFEFGRLRAADAPGASASQGRLRAADAPGASASQGRLRAADAPGASASQGRLRAADAPGASASQGRPDTAESPGASTSQGPSADDTFTGELLLIDEVLTPDSSRFWPADRWTPGGPQPSYDKQFVRDHLEAIRWDKQPPVPSLPGDVIARTRDKYLEAYSRLTGRAWS